MVTQIPKSRTGKNGLNFSTRKLAESGKLAFYRRSPEFEMGNLSLGGTFQNLTVPRDPMCKVERAYILEGYKCGAGALPTAKPLHTVPPISNVQSFGMIATEILPVWSGRHKSSAAPSLLFPLTTVAPPQSRDPTSQNHIVQLPGQGRPDNELEEDGGNELGFPPPAMQAARKQENGYSDP